MGLIASLENNYQKDGGIKLLYENVKEKIKMKEELEKKLNDINSKIDNLNEKLHSNNCTEEEFERLFNYKSELYQVRSELEDDIRYLIRQIEVSDGEIELTYLRNNTPKFKQYSIYECGNKEEIGCIEYRDYDSIYGNVGYRISEKYNGHNYAAKAVNLLKEILRKEGVENIIISADKNNIASIKTIEKVGGNLIDSPDSNIVTYICSTDLEKQK